MTKAEIVELVQQELGMGRDSKIGDYGVLFFEHEKDGMSSECFNPFNETDSNEWNLSWKYNCVSILGWSVFQSLSNETQKASILNVISVLLSRHGHGDESDIMCKFVAKYKLPKKALVKAALEYSWMELVLAN